MKLNPKIGIDNLKFGMSSKECCEILGDPDRIVEDQKDNEITLEFNTLKFRLTFYLNKSDSLGYIRTSNQNLVFKGHKIINSKVGFAIDEIFGLKISDWEKEEYDFFTTYFNEENWIILVVEYGVITEVEIGVPFKNDEEYDWPK